MKYSTRVPEKNELFLLFSSSDWPEKLNVGPEDLELAAQNSYVVISVYENDQLIGFGALLDYLEIPLC